MEKNFNMRMTCESIFLLYRHENGGGDRCAGADFFHANVRSVGNFFTQFRTLLLCLSLQRTQIGMLNSKPNLIGGLAYIINCARNGKKHCNCLKALNQYKESIY